MQCPEGTTGIPPECEPIPPDCNVEDPPPECEEPIVCDDGSTVPPGAECPEPVIDGLCDIEPYLKSVKNHNHLEYSHHLKMEMKEEMKEMVEMKEMKKAMKKVGKVANKSYSRVAKIQYMVFS